MNRKLFILGNGVDWCERSLQGISEFKNVYLINKKIPVKGNLKGKMARVFFSYRLNNKLKIPFKSFWYQDIRKYIKNHICNDDEICVLIYDHNVFGIEITFLNYLRKVFQNVKLVYIFTNIVKFTNASDRNFVEQLNNYYDVVYAFDQNDAKKYHFNYSPLLYSKNVFDVELKEQVFYVGKAKDRFEMLIKIYEKLKELQINSKFYIFDVPEEKQVYKDEIIYNQYIPYDECLKNIQESTCLIDSIQGDSSGYTIKNCEAVYYDKLLITTNQNVKNAPFYDKENVLIIHSADDITKAFFENQHNVHYSNEAREYFSVNTFLKMLYLDLENK